MFDLILTIILAGFVFYGLFFGLIKTLGAITGIFIGALVASKFYLTVFDWLGGTFTGFEALGKVVTFILVFTIVKRFVEFIFSVLNQIFNIISIIPFLKSINRIAGAILGFFQGSLLIGLVIYIISRYAAIGDVIGIKLINSKLAPFFLKVAELLVPLLPDVLKDLQSLI